MRRIGRAQHIATALAAGALLSMVGCQQLAFNAFGPSAQNAGNQLKEDGTVTPAQEADVQISMGRVAESQGELDQAMAAYRAAITRDKRRADALLRMAVLNDKKGKFRESAELYHKALAMRPGDPEIFCDMGYSLYLQRRWAEAEMNLRQAIAASPEFPRAHNNLALLLVRDNRLDDALDEFRKAGNSAAQAHLNLAFALTMEHRFQPAQAEYQRALALDPSSEIAKTRLKELNGVAAKLELARGHKTVDPRVVPTSAAVAVPRSLPEAPVMEPYALSDRRAAKAQRARSEMDQEQSDWMAHLQASHEQSLRELGPIMPPTTRGLPRHRPTAPTAAKSASPDQPALRIARSGSESRRSETTPLLSVEPVTPPVPPDTTRPGPPPRHDAHAAGAAAAPRPAKSKPVPPPRSSPTSTARPEGTLPPPSS